MVMKSLQFSIVAVGEDTNDTSVGNDGWQVNKQISCENSLFPKKIDPRDEITGVLLEEREENLIYTGTGCVDCTLV